MSTYSSPSSKRFAELTSRSSSLRHLRRLTRKSRRVRKSKTTRTKKSASPRRSRRVKGRRSTRSSSVTKSAWSRIVKEAWKKNKGRMTYAQNLAKCKKVYSKYLLAIGKRKSSANIPVHMTKIKSLVNSAF